MDALLNTIKTHGISTTSFSRATSQVRNMGGAQLTALLFDMLGHEVNEPLTDLIARTTVSHMVQDAIKASMKDGNVPDVQELYTNALKYAEDHAESNAAVFGGADTILFLPKPEDVAADVTPSVITPALKRRGRKDTGIFAKVDAFMQHHPDMKGVDAGKAIAAAHPEVKASTAQVYVSKWKTARKEASTV